MSQLRLTTTADLLRFQLRTALSMEHDSLAALEELSDASRAPDVVQLLRHHMDETKEQIDNLTKAFGLLQLDPSTAGSPATKGISAQARSLLERIDEPDLTDLAVLSSAMGNEHYEIAAYESLVAQTRTPHSDVAALLQANLDQEIHTSEEIKQQLLNRTS
jgi:ferritin-like metal-binding protein YciE